MPESDHLSDCLDDINGSVEILNRRYVLGAVLNTERECGTNRGRSTGESDRSVQVTHLPRPATTCQDSIKNCVQDTEDELSMTRLFVSMLINQVNPLHRLLLNSRPTASIEGLEGGHSLSSIANF